MSIIAISSSNLETLLSITLLAMVPMALFLVMYTGFFKTRNILGPQRIGSREDLGVLLIVMLMAVVMWIAVPAAFGTTMKPVQTTSQPATQTAEPIATPSLALAGMVGGMIGFVVALGGNILTRRDGLSLLGFKWKPNTLMIALAGSIVTIGLVLPAAQLTELFWQWINYSHPKEHQLLKLTRDSDSALFKVLFTFSAVVVAPLFEETLFRGHLQTLFAYGIANASGQKDDAGLPYPKRASRWAAIIITALLFALVHDKWTWPPLFLFGVCMGYVYERTGNLWPVILMHAAFNALSTALYIFVVSH